MEIVSLAEAARLASKSRNTLKSHLKSGKLSGSQNEAGEWEIQVSELIRVYGNLPGVAARDQGNDAQDSPARPSTGAPADLIAENAVLNERLKQQQQRYSDERNMLVEQIDFLKEQVEKKDSHLLSLTAQIEDHRDRRAKTEDRADEKEKAMADELEKYKRLAHQERQARKQDQTRYRRELEEARQSAGWSGFFRKLIGSDSAPVREHPEKSA